MLNTLANWMTVHWYKKFNQTARCLDNKLTAKANNN